MKKLYPALVKTKVECSLLLVAAIFSQEKSPAEQIHYFEQLINSLTELNNNLLLLFILFPR